MFTVKEAEAFYNRFGSKQDQQAFYEDPATKDLTAHAELATAQNLLELGCGTGRYAANLLEQTLCTTARYLGLDLSATMVELAKQRLAAFGDRATVEKTTGPLPQLEGRFFDRIFSNYVLDLLPPHEIEQTLNWAQDKLAPEGLLCLVSITPGPKPWSRLISLVWKRVFALSPALVGGCRPIRVQDFLSASHWDIRYRHIVTAFGVASEVVVAKVKKPKEQTR